MSEETLTLKERMDRLDEIFNSLSEKDEKKIKKILKVPRKAKVRKSRLKKGWVGVLFVNPNRVIKGEKVKLDGGAFQTKDKNYHVTDGHEMFFWEGKFPMFWQRYDKLNPTNLFPKAGDKNEIYGQDTVKLTMERDLIKEKKKGGGLGWLYIIAILVGGYFIINALFPGLFGG